MPELAQAGWGIGGSRLSGFLTQPHQPAGGSLLTRQGLATDLNKGCPRLPDQLHIRTPHGHHGNPIEHIAPVKKGTHRGHTEGTERGHSLLGHTGLLQKSLLQSWEMSPPYQTHKHKNSDLGKMSCLDQEVRTFLTKI